MPLLLIIMLALVMLLVCIVVVAGQQKRDDKLNELLLAYEDALLRYANGPEEHNLVTAARHAGEAFYAAHLPGAFSLHFQAAHHPIDDFYNDYRSLAQALMAADVTSFLSKPSTKHAPNVQAKWSKIS